MIKIDHNYTDYRDDTDPKYPGGKAVNATTAESTDGTPLLADWMNDVNGALQAIFIEAFGDIDKVSGKPDDVQESDVLKAIKKITQEYTNQINAVEGRARAQGDIETLRSAESYIEKMVQAEAQARIKGEVDTLKSAKDYTDGLLIKIFQNGYIQWPGMPSPLEDTNLHFEGYSWYEVSYRGNFFRAKGDNAKAFSAKRLTKEQIKNGAYIFQDDEQGDAIRNIYGETGFGYVNANAAISNGVFKVLNPGYTHGVVTQGISNSSMSLLSFQAALVVPTAEENRSRNLTFTIWVLVKD